MTIRAGLAVFPVGHGVEIAAGWVLRRHSEFSATGTTIPLSANAPRHFVRRGRPRSASAARSGGPVDVQVGRCSGRHRAEVVRVQAEVLQDRADGRLQPVRCSAKSVRFQDLPLAGGTDQQATETVSFRVGEYGNR